MEYFYFSTRPEYFSTKTAGSLLTGLFYLHVCSSLNTPTQLLLLLLLVPSAPPQGPELGVCRRVTQRWGWRTRCSGGAAVAAASPSAPPAEPADASDPDAAKPCSRRWGRREETGGDGRRWEQKDLQVIIRFLTVEEHSALCRTNRTGEREKDVSVRYLDDMTDGSEEEEAADDTLRRQTET